LPSSFGFPFFLENEIIPSGALAGRKGAFRNRMIKPSYLKKGLLKWLIVLFLSGYEKDVRIH